MCIFLISECGKNDFRISIRMTFDLVTCNILRTSAFIFTIFTSKGFFSSMDHNVSFHVTQFVKFFRTEGAQETISFKPNGVGTLQDEIIYLSFFIFLNFLATFVLVMSFSRFCLGSTNQQNKTNIRYNYSLVSRADVHAKAC